MSRQRDGRHRGRDHREDRRPIDRRGGNKPREERNLNKRDRHRPQNTSVSKPRSIPDNGAMNTEQSRTPLSPWAPSNDDHTPSSRGNTRQEEEVSEVKTDHSIADPDDESEGEITDEKTPLTQSEILEKEFAWDFQKIFAEVSAEHKGDPIGEPLPSEYTEKIMLPPAFDATGIKSKHITSSNLDDFALSVRDGNQWAKYRQHPTFLDPLKITPPHLETYYKSISKGQGSRNDRRDRLGPPPHAGKFHRDHIKNREQRSHRNHGDIDNQASSQRKRKWDERAHLVNPNYNGPHKIPSRPENSSGQAFKANRLLSPEPGELSETSSTVAEVSQHAILPSHADDFEWRQRTDDLHSKFDNDNYYSPALRSYKHFNDEASAWRRSPEPRRQHVTTSRSPVLVRPTEPRHPHKSGRHERSFTKEQRERSNSNRSREHGSTQDPSAESEPGRLDMFDDESKPALGRLHLPPSLPKRPPPRRDSQASKIHVTVARSSEREDRRLSPEPISQPESIGSPLTALEAELLGLGPSSGSESGEKSPIIPQQEDQQPKAKRRQPRVDAAFR
ncbi:hypothetical protein BX600DRAFT_12105 [Xylariales sp. PMI_506]|nr:hypothetical protein BX600DRAFT_12105 [Xylariales sp. PMI_506]